MLMMIRKLKKIKFVRFVIKIIHFQLVIIFVKHYLVVLIHFFDSLNDPNPLLHITNHN
jgi:hypothetical protein